MEKNTIVRGKIRFYEVNYDFMKENTILCGKYDFTEKSMHFMILRLFYNITVKCT